MTKAFWEDIQKQMKAEGYNNFSAYVQFLLKMRRELLDERRREGFGKQSKSGGSALNEGSKSE